MITEEHEDQKSGYSIDMRVEGNHAGTDVVWAVEVDGPSHFLQVRSTLSWCGTATDPTVFILFETVSLASKK